MEDDCWASGCGYDIIYSSVMIFWQGFACLSLWTELRVSKTTPKQTILTPTPTETLPQGLQVLFKNKKACCVQLCPWQLWLSAPSTIYCVFLEAFLVLERRIPKRPHSKQQTPSAEDFPPKGKPLTLLGAPKPNSIPCHYS